MDIRWILEWLYFIPCCKRPAGEPTREAAVGLGLSLAMQIAGSGEIVQRVEKEFTPIISQAPGFIAYYVVDGGDGMVASIASSTIKRVLKSLRD